MIIRKYQVQDKKNLLTLLRKNTPDYFSPDEEKDFIFYLDHEVESYYVVENEKDELIGCGGINFFSEKRIAHISWDIISPEYQKTGVGSLLLKHRIEQIKQRSEITTIVVRTSQLAYLFYKKFGFELLQTQKDYWGQGLDLYYMELSTKSL